MKLLQQFEIINAPGVPIYLFLYNGKKMWRVGAIGGAKSMNAGIDYQDEYEARKGALEIYKLRNV